MKSAFLALALSLFFLMVCVPASAQTESKPYHLEKDAEVAKNQPGPHGGGGESVSYSFFDQVKDYKTAFKKRVLKPGSSIGYHLQREDEVYYILSGTGEMVMNGKTMAVQAGDAILTRPGSSHSIRPTNGQELTLLIVYEKK